MIMRPLNVANVSLFRIKILCRILKKPDSERSRHEIEMIQQSKASGLNDEAESRIKRSMTLKERSLEIHDDPEVVSQKSLQLAQIISSCSHLVVYTGAGISTSASIPDYRGPSGIWTIKKKTGRHMNSSTDMFSQIDLSSAQPTTTHMAISQLVQSGMVKHVVSQNCDGLHIRSGLCPDKLSEIHGNMTLEVCADCDKQFFRDFDVTEKTSRHKHLTGRKCTSCNGELVDTIVHFGEKRAKLKSPQNWLLAAESVKKADVILCLGTSLQVLKSYKCLWPKSPQLIIVNLMWTPKDKSATLKINGRCDDVLQIIMGHLKRPILDYKESRDPLKKMLIPLEPHEHQSTKRKKIFNQLCVEERQPKK